MASENKSEPFLKALDSTKGLWNPMSMWKHSFTKMEMLNQIRKSAVSYDLVAALFLLTLPVWRAAILYVTSHCPRAYRVSGKYANHTKIYGMSVPGYQFRRCGTSVQKAKALGCEYDISTNHWVLKQCMDREAANEYQSDGPWYGLAHEGRTEIFSLEVMGERPHYYTSERDHIVHCAILWRKQYRAFSEGRKNIDSSTADPEHTFHCSQYLMDMTEDQRGPQLREILIVVEVGFTGCYFED